MGRGLTDRGRLRLTRNFPDTVSIFRLKGKTEEDVDIWDNLGEFNGKLIEGSGSTYGADNMTQLYNARVNVLTSDNVNPVSFSDPSDKYRVVVTQFRSDLEKQGEGPDQEEKRTRYLDVVGVQAFTDPAGTDIAVELRCKNGVRV